MSFCSAEFAIEFLLVGSTIFCHVAFLAASVALFLASSGSFSRSSFQMDIMKNQIPLPDMTWSVKDLNTFIQHPLIHSLMIYDTQYNNREIEYIEHNYSSDASSL